MGQKVNPHGLRVGVIKDWDTQWFAGKKEFADYIKEDYVIREYIKKAYFQAAISKIVIERAASRVTVTVHTARPGVLIGKAGSEIEVIKASLSKLAKGKQVAVNIIEVKKPDCDAQLIAENVAAFAQGFKNVNPGNGTAGTDGGTAVPWNAQDDHRAVELLTDLAGGKPDEPGIPAFACGNEHAVLRKGGRLCDLAKGFRGDFPLHALAPAVHFLQLPRGIIGFFRDAGQQ